MNIKEKKKETKNKQTVLEAALVLGGAVLGWAGVTARTEVSHLEALWNLSIDRMTKVSAGPAINTAGLSPGRARARTS